jgi:hypothetical protein
MGILLEADYKGVLQGREPILSGLRRAFGSTEKAGTQNPLENGSTTKEYQPQEKDGQLTYEAMNRDSGMCHARAQFPYTSGFWLPSSAVILAKEASKHKVGSFLYVSAAAGAPILPARYISTKRAAEEAIASSFPEMRSIFFRPPFLYDSSRTLTMPIAAAGYAGSMADSLVGGRLSGILGASVMKPFKADLAGDAAVEALDDESVRGPLEPKEIESLGMRAWRKGML